MSKLDPPAEAVAIVGMAGRFPGAPDIAQFWRNLREGVESISFFKPEEILCSPLDEPPNSSDPNVVRARGLLSNPEGFDAPFFNVTPKEAELMDPQHRVFLELSWAALENAGCNPDTTDGLIGVYAGSSQNSYLLWNLAMHGPELLRFGGFQTMLASDKDFLPARVSYKLNLRGPSIAVQTACSTSLVAISFAAQGLLNFQCDVALAGGVSISYPQRQGWIYEEGGILSPDGHCRAFDAVAAGTVPGDGAGVVVLKRLSEALADGDHIWAVIKGSAINNDGARKVGFTAPSIDGQAEVIAMAQAAAGVEPESVSYVEAHGTATPLGDPIELAGLAKAFGDATGTAKSCAIGSVKTNLGHLDAAAGVAGLMKTALALRHREIPPSLHFKNPNPQIDFDRSPFYVNDRLRPWEEGRTPRRAGVSSFGIGGTNAHVVLEEAPAPNPAGPSRELQVLTLSARTESALEAMTSRLAEHLESDPSADLADVAFTLQTGRKLFVHRRALACRGREDAIAALRSGGRRLRTCRSQDKDAPVAFLFPGMGVQSVGMARELYRDEPVFRKEVERCCALLRGHLDQDLLRSIYPSDGAPEDPRALEQTAIGQPALFVIEYSLAKLWMHWGVQPKAMIGHSLGEYTAACLAGVFSLEDALRLVAARARLIEAQPPGAMLAVRMSEDDLAPHLAPGVSLAAMNAPNQCVASGTPAAIDALSERLTQAGAAFRRLATTRAFHSEGIQGAVEPFLAEVRKIRLSAPKIPFVSNVTGRWITPQEATDPAYWAGHLRSPVRFADGLDEILRDPKRLLLEVGPGRTLGPLARRPGSATVVVASLGGEEGDCSSLSDALGQLWICGVSIDWRAYHSAQRRKVPLPSYPFERKSYRIGDAATEAPRAATPAQAKERTEARRSGGVLDEIKGLLQELSGVDLSAAPANATFLELGFDSLFLTQAGRALHHRFGVSVTFRQLLEELSTLEKLSGKIEANLSTAAGGRGGSSAPKAKPAEGPSGDAATAPLTEEQREIWFAAQMGASASAAYNQSFTVRLQGSLDRPALERAIQQLAARHEALRLTVEPTGERQRIDPPAPVEVSFADLSSDPKAEAVAAARIGAELEQAFDLSKGPLLRVRLMRISESQHLLTLVLHHIICDGWTLGLLAAELSELYSSEHRGLPASLPPALSFSEFARRQVAEGEGDGIAEAEAHWLEQFSDCVPILELPADRPRPAARTYTGDQRARTLSPAATAAVRKLGAERGCTTFTMLFAAFNVLIHRMSGQDDVVIGVPVAAQVFDGAERLAGHCVNLLPFRSRVSDGQTFSEYLARTQEVIWTGFEHWRYPFGRLLRKLKVSRDPARVPLSNVTFNLSSLRGALSYADLESEFVIGPKRFVNFDLSFDFTEASEVLILDCRYSTELFDEATIERLVRRYEDLLLELAADPNQRVDDVPLLSKAEARQILVGWNQTEQSYPRRACIHELFSEQARETPDAVAIAFGHERITYRELDRQSDELVERLRALGVGRDVLVGLFLSRTPRLLVSILAILKAGGAYVPLDPEYPAARLAAIAGDARFRVVVTERALLGRVPGRDAAVLCVDELDSLDLSAVRRPVAAPGPDSLAYVIYTSGSTGTPKGVPIEHHSVCAFVSWARGVYGPDECAGVLASTSICFDVSVFEIFVPLCMGGTVILVGNVLQLAHLDRAAGVTLVSTVPSAMAELVRTSAIPPSVVTVNLAGEALSQELVEQIYQVPGIQRVYDLYGPTEDTVYSTFALRKRGGRATIGRSLANKRAYVLDARMHPVPPGMPGELYLGGAGLARGYLNRPELTAEKFVRDPFNREHGSRLYRTGDLVRRRADGEIEFIGRLDHQVKLRGYRIELGDIESALREIPAVSACVVVLREDRPGDRRLVAYLEVPAPEAALPEFRQHLRERLPEYMIPSLFVTLQRLPVSPNGKIDRKALPSPEGGSGAAESGGEPATATEKALAKIWRDLIGIERIGRQGNFFDLGGHSLLAMQLLTRVEEGFAVTLPLRTVFDAPTLSGLSSVIEAAVIMSVADLDDEEARQAVSEAAF